LAWVTKISSSSYSPLVSVISAPSRVSVRASRLTLNGPKHCPRRIACCRRGRAAVSTHHRADARQQLARVERLGQVIVGADLEADDAVDILALGRQHDDGRKPRLPAQAPRHRQAVLARHHPVQHQEIRQAPGQQTIECRRVFGRLDRIALAGQVFGDQLADAGIVVGDVDGVFFHAATIAAA
jgi:hypothetical protein